MTRPTVHLITDTDRRGAQVFAQQLVARLDGQGRGWHRLVAMRDTGGGIDAEILAGADAAALREMAGDSVVVAHGSRTLDLCARAVPGRFLYRSIGDPAFWGRRLDRRLKTARLLRRAQRVIALWPGAATSLRERYRVPADRIIVSPNAIEPHPPDPGPASAVRASLGLDPATRIVAHVGALSWEKRIHLIVDAVSQTDAHLVCVGEGSLRTGLQAHAAAAAPGRVHFTGSVVEPTSYLAAADVLALASCTEGMPGCVLEALHAGVPVVASPVGGLPDLARDISGITLVDPEDPSALAAALTAEPVARPSLPAAFHMRQVSEHWAALLDPDAGGSVG